MRAGEIVPLREPDPAVLLARIADVRASGAVPLVGDDRWPDGHWSEVVRSAAAARVHPGIGWATLTSGSTGRPRVLLRTAESWQASFGAVEELLRARPGDVMGLPAPPASSLSLFSIAHGLAGGPPVVLGRGHALVASDFASATLFHGTPYTFRQLLDQGAPDALRAALIGGSALDAALRSRAEAAGIRVVSYYGAAELSFVAADTGAGLRPFPGVQVELRDGEIRVRSPFVSAGYLDGAAGPLRSASGWHTVGDRGEWVDGALRILGRSDDAILTSSATVIPGEVEEALRGLPGIADAVVIGLPHDGIGSLVAAVIEPTPDAPTPTARSLAAAAAAVLTTSHRPRRWFAARLPRTATGKPARAELLRRIQSGEVAALGR